MSNSWLVPVVRRLTSVVSLSFFLLFSTSLFAQSPAPPAPAQDSGARTDSSAKPAPTVRGDTQEVSTRDTPTTFKVHVNLVLVRVVVRDAQGKVVPNLKKEDFQLFDNRKPQTVSSFSIEALESITRRNVASPGAAAEPSSTGDTLEAKSPEANIDLPRRFVSLVFDDMHLAMQDAVFVRDSASRFLSSLATIDRAAIYTTSGQLSQDFTQDHEALKKALLGIVPRGLASSGIRDCPDVEYYQADLIANRGDTQALAVATEDALQCAFGGDANMRASAQALAQTAAQRALSTGDNDTQYAYRHLEDVVRRLSNMPGQRVLVLISPGFLQTTLHLDASDLVDRATRSNVVINTIDARGLYGPDLGGDIANPSHDSYRTVGLKSSYRVAAQFAQEEVLEQFADGTGGTFFHNRNDLDQAMREAGAAPEISYLLGFSPQNLKLDGRYHTLKVALTNKSKYTLQARHGYFAPRTVADPEEAMKQEMQEALFSQEEIRDLPVELQTQFFKKDQAEARLAVLSHFDLKGIRFRKVEGRNNDKLTIITGIFDENGNLVTGVEKIVEMKLLDTTYDKLSRSGFTVKSSFDVKPGAYLVRLVVRDAEGAQMAARNGTVVIPN